MEKTSLGLMKWDGVESESDFNRFCFYKANREPDTEHIDDIVSLIEGSDGIAGTKSIIPIIVIEGDDNKLLVVDGQHRVQAARQLSEKYNDIEVPFIPIKMKNKTNKDQEEIISFITKINSKPRAWKLDDLLDSFAEQGDILSKKVLEIHEKQGKEKLRKEDILSILCGKWAGKQGSFTELIKRGVQKRDSFRIVSPNNINAVAHVHSIYNDLIKISNNGIRHPKMAIALIQASLKEETSSILLMEKRDKLISLCEKIRDRKVFIDGSEYGFPIVTQTKGWKEIFTWVALDRFPDGLKVIN